MTGLPAPGLGWGPASAAVGNLLGVFLPQPCLIKVGTDAPKEAKVLPYPFTQGP